MSNRTTHKIGDDQRKRDLARIHILSAELQLDRVQYENVLALVAGVDSSTALDTAGRRNVIAHLQAHVDRLNGVQPDPDRPANVYAKPQLRKIEAQLRAANRGWAYARSIANRLYGKTKIEFCDTRELSGVIAALAIDAERHCRGARR
ncbi:MAG: regulatory protein GemA [Nevskia sp.]|jgi:phage gp16-like protein|nr:regulatory protein GemA [Nevskia sp.]MCK9385076.1 regulatory protein GemA [Nevskia sp.]